MAYKGLNVLAVVPARGGSKSIPKKNLCKVGGISLVGRAAEMTCNLPWIDKAIISTDDIEIIEEANKYGLEAPFIRPEELANDTATSVDMWIHAWKTCEEIYKTTYDVSILLEPTSPLRTIDDVERTMATLIEGNYLAAATVTRTPAHYTPHKCLTIDKGEVGFYLKSGSDFSIRQKIPAYYHRNGICYAVTRECLLERKSILEDNCAAVIIDHPVVNIDEPFELEVAEFFINIIAYSKK